MEGKSQTKQERLAHIDFRLYFLGDISRNDLKKRFGVADAAATRDLADYKKQAEGNLIYDSQKRIYKVSGKFTPQFQYQPERVLAALSQGLGDDQITSSKPYIPCETPSQLNKPDVQVLSKISRAIYNQEALSIKYRSVRSGLTERVIIPFCLVDNGLRWHVRAYDRRRGQFMDLVLTRISDPVAPSDPTPLEHESKEFDKQWNRIVELEIVAHPQLEHKDTIEMDYAMEDGVLKMDVRAAVAGYILRRWNVDCSKDAKLRGDEYHLWLKNRQALYGVDNLKIAPGFESDPL